MVSGAAPLQTITETNRSNKKLCSHLHGYSTHLAKLWPLLSKDLNPDDLLVIPSNLYHLYSGFDQLFSTVQLTKAEVPCKYSMLQWTPLFMYL